MKEPIRFAGLDLHTDEQSAPNSALALCAGVECEGGSLKPSFLAYTDLHFQPVFNSLGQPVFPVLVYIHESSSYKHFICRFDDDGCVMYGCYRLLDNGAYSWSLIPVIESDGDESVQIQHVGNTLIFNISGTISYVLFKQDAQFYGYKYLGQKPPFVELQFGTTERVVHEDIDEDLKPKSLLAADNKNVPNIVFFRHDKSAIDKASNLLEESRGGHYGLSVKQEHQSDFTESVKAFLNKANDFLAKKGCFYAPFMVRYAYRMYDGKTLIMHSAPVYIPVSDKANTFFSGHYGQYALAVFNFQQGLSAYAYDNISFYAIDVGSATAGKYTYEGGLCYMYYPGNVQLQYKCLNIEAFNKIKNDWADIIKSIDVFITPPIVNWDQSELIKKVHIAGEKDVHRTETLVNGTYTDEILSANEEPHLLSGETRLYTEVFVDLPKSKLLTQEEMVRNASNFFLLHSFPVEKSLSTDMTKVPYKDDILPVITTQEQMVDDYLSHNIISGNFTFVYNHRFHLADITEKVFSGFDLNILLPYCTKYRIDGYDSTNNSNIFTAVKNINVQLKTVDGVKNVQLINDGSWSNICVQMFAHFFYPDPRAIGMTIQVEEGYLNIPLAECPGLNGAAWFGSPSAIVESAAKFFGPSNNQIYQPSQLYISPIDNPFVFEPSDIMTVGTGRILGMAVSTRAISQGQYGTFPLTVFCSDGIWTFSVNSEGKYLQPSYLSSAITNNPAMLTQLDQSVIFPTKQAVNMLYGGDIRQISAPVNGLTFNTSDYPKLIDYLDKVSNDYDPAGDFLHPWHIMMYQDCRNPVEDITSSRCIYDAVNERLIFVKMVAEQYDRRELTMAYVYSLATDSWSTLPMPQVTNVVNAAPHPYLTLADGTSVCLDQRMDADSSSTNRYGVIVTRALKFEGVHKCIQAFDHSHSMGTPPMMFLYGSNNLQKWYYIGRSNQLRSAYMPGATWRYFRMCLLLDMTAAERFYVTHLDIVEKYRKL